MDIVPLKLEEMNSIVQSCPWNKSLVAYLSIQIKIEDIIDAKTFKCTFLGQNQKVKHTLAAAVES